MLVVLVGNLPGAEALSVHPGFFSQCFGTQEGTAIPAVTGVTFGGVFANNYSNGSISLASQVAKAGSFSLFRTQGWISMGPGPANGTCFSPSSSASSLTYRFGHLSYTVALKANCTAGHGTVASSYTLALSGNLYDLSAGAFATSTAPTTAVASHTTSCTGGHSSVYTHTFHLPGTITVTGYFGSLSPSDSYWFLVWADLQVSSSASGPHVHGSATVTGLSVELLSISCPYC